MPDFIHTYLKQKQHSCRRRSLSCLGLIALVLILSCGLIFWAVQTTAAAPATQTDDPLAIYLLIDNSQSMFEKDGIGTDPDQLRIDAARLFTTHLGTENGRSAHQCGIIFFGSDAQLTVPLTPLNSPQHRQQLYQQIQDPPQMGWTNHLAALQLAYAQFQQHNDQNGRPALILLTDGKPESKPNSPIEPDTYLTQLQAMGKLLDQANIPLFIILLANETTDADSEITTRWRPLWQEMAPNRYYEARQATDLFAIYHDIVVTLTDSHSDGTIIDSPVDAAGLRQTISVEPNLARLTLVVSKSSPDISVTIHPPAHAAPTVQQTGTATEEVWTVDNPHPGNWTIEANGQGHLTVWKDYRPLAATVTPLPTSSSTSTATASSTPASRPIVTSSPTAVPTTAPTLTPTATPLPAPPAVAPTPPSTSTPQRPLWPWLLGTATLIITTAVFFLHHHRRRQRPLLTGTLRLLSGTPAATLELEPHRKTKLTLGLPPADIPLAAARDQLTLQAGSTADDIQLSAPVPLTINGVNQPNTAQLPHSLRDNDLIRFGNLTLRYENLRLRRSQSRPPHPAPRDPFVSPQPTPLPRFTNENPK